MFLFRLVMLIHEGSEIFGRVGMFIPYRVESLSTASALHVWRSSGLSSTIAFSLESASSFIYVCCYLSEGSGVTMPTRVWL